MSSYSQQAAREILINLIALVSIHTMCSVIYCHRSSYRTPDTRALNLKQMQWRTT